MESRPCLRSYPKVRLITTNNHKDENTYKYSRYKITSITMVPSIIHQFVHSPKAAKADLSSVYLIGCGAAYLAPDLAEKLKSMLGHLPNGEGAALPEGYGLSEAVNTF